MRDDTHAYTNAQPFHSPPRKPFEVIERIRVPAGGTARRTDTTTGSLRYAIERRDTLRRQGRPAFIRDLDGRRVEVARWL